MDCAAQNGRVQTINTVSPCLGQAAANPPTGSQNFLLSPAHNWAILHLANPGPSVGSRQSPLSRKKFSNFTKLGRIIRERP